MLGREIETSERAFFKTSAAQRGSAVACDESVLPPPVSARESSVLRYPRCDQRTSSQRITVQCTLQFTAKVNVRSNTVHHAPPCAFRRGSSAFFDLPGSAQRPRCERRRALVEFVPASPPPSRCIGPLRGPCGAHRASLRTANVCSEMRRGASWPVRRLHTLYCIMSMSHVSTSDASSCHTSSSYASSHHAYPKLGKSKSQKVKIFSGGGASAEKNFFFFFLLYRGLQLVGVSWDGTGQGLLEKNNVWRSVV